MVRHGGAAYRAYGSPTSAAGSFGVGIARPVGTRLQLTAGVTALCYALDVAMPPELRGNAGSLQHGSQTDALVQFGVRWRPW